MKLFGLIDVDIPKLKAALQKGDLENFDSRHWEQVILDLWKEEVAQEQVIQYDPLVRNFFEARPYIGVSTHFCSFGPPKEKSVVKTAIFFFKNHLSLKSRQKLTKALTVLTREMHIIFCEDRELKDFLGMALHFATHLGGGIEPVVLEKIAADTNLDPTLRAEAMAFFFQREVDIPPLPFWKKIEEEVTTHPIFAFSLIYYYLHMSDWDSVLNVLRKLKKQDHDGIIIPIVRMLRAQSRAHHQKALLERTFQNLR